MGLSLRIKEEEEEYIRTYAKVNNISVSELIRTAVLEKIEDECDLEEYNKAMKEYNKNSKTYTIDEVEKELGI